MPLLHQQSHSWSFTRVTSPYLLLWEQILSKNPTAPPLDEQISSEKTERVRERGREKERKKESMQLSTKQTGDHKVGV